MSFLGITFSNQKVTPSDDALLRQSILSDGILSGCTLQCAGFTLTMAAGNLVIAGRQINHTVSESWSMAGATTGYARLILTIDLSKTATEDAFEQIEASVEYAADANGFPALEQSEINISGAKYQSELCVVALGTGGITGIIRKITASGLQVGPEFLAQLLSAGYMQVSAYQLVESVEAIPEDAPEGALFLVLGSEVT